MTLSCDILLEDQRWAGRMDIDSVVNSVVQTALEVTNVTLNEMAEASFTFADDKRLQELNKIWRKKDSPTNVLSFPAAEGAALKTSPLLGDVVLAYETIDREASEEGKVFTHHAAHMIAHGFLHLIGFDHENDVQADEMERVETKVLSRLGMPDPWASRENEGNA
jgi:probable rRNA maturation factor